MWSFWELLSLFMLTGSWKYQPSSLLRSIRPLHDQLHTKLSDSCTWLITHIYTYWAQCYVSQSLIYLSNFISQLTRGRSRIYWKGGGEESTMRANCLTMPTKITHLLEIERVGTGLWRKFEFLSLQVQSNLVGNPIYLVWRGTLALLLDPPPCTYFVLYGWLKEGRERRAHAHAGSAYDNNYTHVCDGIWEKG